ncbi:MAG: DMT family transporter [Candidatus Methanofastidiosia archaeon]
MINPKYVLFLGILAVSFASILIRLSDAPPLVIATFRLGLAGFLMLGFTVFKGEVRELKVKRKDFAALILAGFFLAIHFSSWITSLSYTSIASSVLITDSSPIFVVALSYLLLRERISRVAIFGILISILGGGFIALSDSNLSGNLYGDFLALVGALSLAFYIVVARNLRGRMNLLPFVSMVYLLTFVFLLTFSLLMREKLSGYPFREYLLFFLLALGPSCIGHTSYNYCLKYLKAAVVSVSILGEPVGATLLAIIIFYEIPTSMVVLGGIFVVFGILLVVKEAKA